MKNLEGAPSKSLNITRIQSRNIWITQDMFPDRSGLLSNGGGKGMGENRGGEER